MALSRQMASRRALIGAVLGMVLAAAAAVAPAYAEERDTIIYWGDYDIFSVSDQAGGFRACERACERDPRCKAWTFIAEQRQCRLKHAVGRKEANTCCVSGTKNERQGENREEFCAQFASNAVRAIDDNLSHRCGFLGPRGQSDYDTHYRWCLRSERDDASAESEARSAEIKRCTAADTRGKGLQAACRHYARTATEEAASNAKARCGFTGERWAADEQAHLNWCLSASLSSIRDETEAREQELARCFAAAADKGMSRACESYAEEAVAVYRSSLTSGCGFQESVRWNASQPTHHRWCASASEADRRREASIRADELARCSKQQTAIEDCRAFAQTAVQLSQNARENGCGFRGHDWSERERDQLQRCLALTEGERREIAEARRDELQRCITLRNENPRCRQFAQLAVRLGELNEAQRCDLEQGAANKERWSADFTGHYQWCRTQPPTAVRNEAAGRLREIIACARRTGFELPPDLLR